MPGHPAFDLTGKVAVVTGGNRGIGLGMSRGLAQAGAAVCVWGRDEAKNGEALDELRSIGADAHAIRCDVADEDAVEAAMTESVDRLGVPDVCIANAGVVAKGSSIVDYETAEWRRVLGIDLDGVFFTLRAAAARMVAAGRPGSLVSVSSIAAIHGQPRHYPYAAAKGAIVSLTRGLAVELARKNIRVNSVLPGWTPTGATESLVDWSDDMGRRLYEAISARIPSRRWANPDDFGGIAVYLASDASAYHTGDCFVIDGGYTIF